DAHRLDDRRAGVDREDDALREAVHVGDEAVADPHRHHQAVRAGAEVAAVVRLGGRVARLAGAVAVVDLVEGVVVTLEEIPARDVVDVAVAAVVDPSEKIMMRSSGSMTPLPFMSVTRGSAS